MERRAAKELLHIRGWLQRVETIVARGESAYLDETCSRRQATRS
jgi:hypothetical protein